MPSEGGDKKTKQPREIASEFVAKKAQTMKVLGGEKYDKMMDMRAKGQTGGKAYKKAEKAAKAEIAANTAKAFGVKNKKSYSKSEQKKALKAALELANQKGRGGIGRQGRSQMKDILKASGENAVRIFGKKGAYQLERALTRTDKGGGKVRKTNRRAYETTQKVQAITKDAKGRTIVKTYDAGARKVKYFDASKPLPKGMEGAVRRYEAGKKGSLGRRTESKPIFGEDGYNGAPSKAKTRAPKAAAAKPKNASTKKAQSKNFKKKGEAKAAPAKKKGEQATKPKSEATTNKPKKEQAAGPRKADGTAAKPTKEAERLLNKKNQGNKPASKPAAKPEAKPAAKPAAGKKPADDDAFFGKQKEVAAPKDALRTSSLQGGNKPAGKTKPAAPQKSVTNKFPASAQIKPTNTPQQNQAAQVKRAEAFDKVIAKNQKAGKAKFDGFSVEDMKDWKMADSVRFRVKGNKK